MSGQLFSMSRFTELHTELTSCTMTLVSVAVLSHFRLFVGVAHAEAPKKWGGGFTECPLSPSAVSMRYNFRVSAARQLAVLAPGHTNSVRGFTGKALRPYFHLAALFSHQQTNSKSLTSRLWCHCACTLADATQHFAHRLAIHFRVPSYI